MSLLITEPEKSYELIDSGEGEKLERFGDFVLARPDPEALWKKNLSEDIWNNADAVYQRSGTQGKWKLNKKLPKTWNIDYGGLVFELRPTSFKHVGIFPEQKSHWVFVQNLIKDFSAKNNRPAKVLNLFAYTGGATLSAAQAGGEVVHVDASEVAVSWARKNATLSGLSEKPIRWIVDDALAFLKREYKRGNKYDVIIMDPPSFGHGPKGTSWKIERDFYELMDFSGKVLSETPVAVILNGYSAGYSPVTLANNIYSMVSSFKGSIEFGELALSEDSGIRLLPAGVFARWKSV